MAGQQKGSWVDINTIVNAFLDENEMPEAKRFKIFQLAFRGMENMGLDYFYSVKSMKSPINANLTANIPEGCIKVLKVGVFSANGEMLNFKRNGNITNYKSASPSRMAVDAPELSYDFYSGVEAYQFSNYYENGYYGNYPYIKSDAYYGSDFNIDEKSGVILLNNNSLYNHVVIQGIVTPEMDGNYYIPIQFKQALISWLDWMNLPKNEKGTGRWTNLMRYHFNQRRLANARFNPFILSQQYDVN